jgi:hypothetical protein
MLSAVGAIMIPLWLFNFRPKRWRREKIVGSDDELKLWLALTILSIFYLLVGSFWFQYWYILWALAPAVLLPDNRIVRITLPWFAFGALSSNVLISFLLATVLKTEPHILRYILEAAIVLGPVILASSVNLLAWRRKKRKSA